MDWMEAVEAVQARLKRPELLAALAEDAAELSRAAMKHRRAITGENPTKYSEMTTRMAMWDALLSVMTCLAAMGYDPAEIVKSERGAVQRKLILWASRLEEDEEDE